MSGQVAMRFYLRIQLFSSSLFAIIFETKQKTRFDDLGLSNLSDKLIIAGNE